ncbi:MG2 domain-containing protein [Cocleimonas flava]|uniref:Alpha-2-macroglobulin family protein n=1 Tax=Cocleimonas flava TaxID=634765 RepID=A0A4R1F886_9GAMM|nr:MG2 domain-containing protein [Cocleimonas flava]TCJ88942.1 hypothetical protein EV695_0802 [Cocleimonas flava]
MLFKGFAGDLKRSLPLTIILALMLNACGGDKGNTNSTDNSSKTEAIKTASESAPAGNATDNNSQAASPSSSVDQATAIIQDTTEAEPPLEKKDDLSAFSWEQLGGWHTQGIVSRDTPIHIDFNRDVVDESMVGKDASKIMFISPEVKGKPVFASKSSIVWKPLEHLKPSTVYKVSIKPVGLFDIPNKAAPFQYTFQVIPLDYEIKTVGLTTDPAVSNGMMLEGQLLVSDRVPSKLVEKVVSAKFQDKTLPIEWTHNTNGKSHKFVVRDIVKETFDADLHLSWDGSAIDIKTKGRKSITVPGSDKFEVTKIAVIHKADSSPFVEVRFSDDLDPNQNLKGLVELAKNKYKVSIDGNRINIYPNRNLAGSFLVRLYGGIKSKEGNKVLSKKIEQKVAFDDAKPKVKFVSKGSILPENSTLEIPFEAVGVNAVEVTAFRIYSDNMKQFLQVGNLSGSNELGRSGRHLWRKVIPLKSADPNKWNRYTFNATELMKKYSGGMIRLTLSIKRRHSTYRCAADTPVADSKDAPLKDMEDYGVLENSGWDGISDYVEGYNNDNSGWDSRNDPCTDSYYRYNSDKTSASQNFIASNIGLITKREANGDLSIISTDIRTAKPLTGTEFEIRNYQGQLLSKATSDGEGFAKVQLSETPFLLVAKKFEDTAYLKLNTKTALAVSHFDVGGKKIKKGIKGFIYGERGVWRPGDDIFLTFVLQNQALNEKDAKKIPDSHPVTMKLIDPRGRVVDTKTSVNSVGGFYAFKFKTEEKAQSGNWMVKAFVGGSSFSKSLMIETVRPNRLKLELNFKAQGENASNKPAEVIYSSEGTPEGTLFSQWLHGATASKLKADVSVKFTQKKTQFGKFTDYVFDDPARSLRSQDTMLLEGRLDDEGYLKFSKDFKVKGKPAGMLKAKFTSRVFEEGGAFSISRSNIDYHPYTNYVGIKLPKGDATRGMLLTDVKHKVSIASLSAKGEEVSLNKVQVSLYKIKWKWWWDKSSESLAEYADSRYQRLLQKDIVSTTDGVGEWNFEVKYPSWGRYLIRVCDLEGTHCTGKTVYIDWPGWAGRAQEEGSGAASRLNLFSDKTAYSVGDVATIQLPATSQGRALLSIETGSRILEQRWVKFTEASTAAAAGVNSSEKRLQFEVPITAEMAPNAYVHITLLQPHEGKSNDRPIRLYGIIPLDVKDAESYLLPKIQAEKEWKPESKQTVMVSEGNGRSMNYTLAVVDEGLLGLTSFKTPNLHRHFYSKEALGIQTWDLFDHVVGAYGGKLERMLALGGGDDEETDDDDSKKRRFPPVVKYLGPFTLAQGETRKHEIELPPYLGAVRVMLVAGEKGAYGKSQQSIFVRQPLMLQSSLPRVLGPQEEVSIPVTLFSMDDRIKDVTVWVETDDLVNVIGEPTQHISFNKMGEKIAFIKVKTANKIGKTRLRFTATASANSTSTSSDKDGRNGEFKSEKVVYLDIRRANQETTRTITQVIEPGKSWDNKAVAFGLEGTNQSVLELSAVPPLNIEKRLNFLIRYPHGCLEQTSSSAFPQLFLSKVMDLTDKQKQDTQLHVQKAIDKLRRFQTGTGDFSYWPGGNYQNDWASVYAGHFLLEAKKLGYKLPANLLNNWLNYQVGAAQGYIVASNKYSHTQAYRLYVLALAGQPQLGAMNRLREAANTASTETGGNNSRLNNKGRWLLAASYQTASQPEAATALIQGMDSDATAVNNVTTPDKTFSSTLGDLGLQLDNLVALNKKQDANKLLEKIAEQMSGDGFQSTQGISWALMGVSRYLGGDTSSFSANLSQDGTPKTINSSKPISSTMLVKAGSNISVENTSGVRLFANLVTKGVPVAGDEISQSKGLTIDTEFSVRDAENKKLWNDLADYSDWKVAQGTDAKLSVSIQNNGNYDAENIALTIPVAAGMEILSASEQAATKSKYDYRDLRDDRIYYYFSLKKGEVKNFELLANASYQGRYYQPAITVEAMYDGNLKAIEKGRFINIIK